MDKKLLVAGLIFLVVAFGAVYKIKSYMQPVQDENAEEWVKRENPDKPDVAPPVPPAQPIVTNPKTVEEAVKIAKAQNKKVLLQFSANWCHNCTEMKVIMKGEAIQNELKNYIVLEIDTDHNKDLVKKYKIRGIPAFRILDNDGKVLKALVGKKSEKDFMRWLSSK